MHDLQRTWIERAERYAEHVYERPEVVHRWAEGCTPDVRAFFSRLYEDRPIALETEDDLLRDLPQHRQRDDWSLQKLSRRAQYLVSTAYQRIWLREQQQTGGDPRGD